MPRLGAAAVISAAFTVLASGTLAAGPPFPQPVAGQVVYDTAGAFDDAYEAEATRIIRGIEARTGAEVVVYTQVKPQADGDVVFADAVALGTQWGVGRRGFDDGLVILFDLQENLKHGQVALATGAGFRASFLSDAEAQSIIDDVMRPYLVNGDLDGALLAALATVDAAATPESAARLLFFRQLNGLLGFGGILAGVLLIGWWLWNWLRHGRDPDYLDDPSIYMPAPPPGLTPATAALILDGRSTRRALTTAMLDLASHGELRFEEEPALPLMRHPVTVRIEHRDDGDDPALVRMRRRPLGSGEQLALRLLTDEADTDQSLDKERLAKFAKKVSEVYDRLEAGAVQAGWFARAPKSVILRWAALGGTELVAALVLFVVGMNLPSDGLVAAAPAVAIAGVVTLGGSRWMPAVTRSGAMIRAMLYAYRRTLHGTMEQARSLRQVVDSRALPWLEAPDQALVWGVALGLHRDVERVLARSLEDLRRDGEASEAWLPAWYVSSGGGTWQAGASGGF